MLLSQPYSLIWQVGPQILRMHIFVPDFEKFSGEIITPLLKGDVRTSGQGDLLDSDLNKSSVQHHFLKSGAGQLLQEGASGFDAWISKFPREEEITLVKKTLVSLKKNPRRIHFAGISCAESVELIREYYRKKGYEDALAKNYIFPLDAQVTVSVNLRHILWCEKDKEFLSQNLLLEGGEENQNKNRGIYKEINPLPRSSASPLKRRSQKPLYALTPPLRSPHDLRALQQSARMGIIMGIEVFPGDEQYLPELLSREILTPFQIAQLVSFRWEKYGFIGETREVQIPLGN